MSEQRSVYTIHEPRSELFCSRWPKNGRFSVKREGKYKALFLYFVGLHALLWTVVPTLVRHTLPMDAMEGATWGHVFQLGYDKNPWLNALLTDWAVRLGGHSGWLVYGFSQVCIALAFYSIWRLGRQFMPAAYALSAVLILEGSQYFHIAAIDFDDNIIEMGLWALITLYFYTAVKKQDLRHWTLVGVLTGLAMMAKYYAIVLMTPMFAFLFLGPLQRRTWTKPGIYLAAALFASICLPHFLWLPEHHYTTLQYALHRTSSALPWWGHVEQPLEFFKDQLMNIAGSLLLFALLYLPTRAPSHRLPLHMDRFDRQYLWVMAAGPLLTTMLLSLFTGIRLHQMWGQPLVIFWGLLLLAAARPAINPQKIQRLFIASLTVMLIVVLGYSYSLLRQGSTSSAQYPGQALAHRATALWHQRFHTPLKYVAGPRWIAGNIAYFSKDSPQVLMEYNFEHSTWINKNNFLKAGALFVWKASDKKIPDQLRLRFPRLQLLRRGFKRQVGLPSLRLGMLPPG